MIYTYEQALENYYAIADAKGGATSPNDMFYFLFGYAKLHNLDPEEIQEIIEWEFELDEGEFEVPKKL